MAIYRLRIKLEGTGNKTIARNHVCEARARHTRLPLAHCITEVEVI